MDTKRNEDPIVSEMPVYLNENLRQQLYMVQFPLRPVYRPMNEAPIAARIKPENDILQLDYPIVRDTTHYDTDAEEYLQQKTLRLQSSKVPALTNYAVGVVRNNQLHLTAIHSTLQMRPSFTHIDEAIEDHEKEETSDLSLSQSHTYSHVEDDGMNGTKTQGKSKDTNQEDEIKEVQFQFKKKQSERAINAIQKSYAFKKQQIMAEEWKELQIYDKESQESDETFDLLFTEHGEEIVSNMSASAYLEALRYRQQSVKDIDQGIDTEALEKEDVDMVDLEEQNENKSGSTSRMKKGPSNILANMNTLQANILRILRTDRVLHFHSLVNKLSNVTESEILEALVQIAVVVSGRLLVKSTYMIDAQSINVAARDAILLELDANEMGIGRIELAEKLALDPDTVKDILQEFAILDPSTRLWTFSIPPDYASVKMHAKFISKMTLSKKKTSKK